METIMIGILNDALPFVGAFTIGYGVYRSIRYTISKIKLKPLKNPIKEYIRKEVVEYLNQLKK
jgi:hypothetical protein